VIAAAAVVTTRIVPGFEKLLVRERSVVYVQSRLTTFDRSNIDRFNF